MPKVKNYPIQHGHGRVPLEPICHIMEICRDSGNYRFVRLIHCYCVEFVALLRCCYSCGTVGRRRRRSWALRRFQLTTFWWWTTWRQWSSYQWEMSHQRAHWLFTSHWEYAGLTDCYVLLVDFIHRLGPAHWFHTLSFCFDTVGQSCFHN